MPSVVSVVDDDPSVRAATNNLLTSRGYFVHTFASAEEFLRSPHLSETACVIADVQMSVMGGLDLLATMRIRGYDVPFIFITAFPDEGVRTRALTAGSICSASSMASTASSMSILPFTLRRPLASMNSLVALVTTV